jgi:phage protein D
MKPDFKVIADNQDITDLLRDRLLSLRTTDKPGLESDDCEIVIDDRDGAVAFPKKGATLEISLGYAGEPLKFVGRYKVDEIEISGPPQSMMIRGKPGDLVASLKEQKRRSWESTTLDAITGDIARDNGLQPFCPLNPAIARADQINESDMHFITRMARQYGATATVKDGKLIVVTRGEGKSGSGLKMPSITLHRDDIASYSLSFPDRALYSEVRASYQNRATGQLQTIVLTNESAPGIAHAPKHTDRHIHPTAAEAQAAAQSRKAALNRATMSGRIELTRGRADVGAEKWLELAGIKDEADGTYLIESVEQNFSRTAWITTIRINAGNEGKSGIGRGDAKKKELQVLKIE